MHIAMKHAYGLPTGVACMATDGIENRQCRGQQRTAPGRLSAQQTAALHASSA